MVRFCSWHLLMAVLWEAVLYCLDAQWFMNRIDCLLNIFCLTVWPPNVTRKHLTRFFDEGKDHFNNLRSSRGMWPQMRQKQSCKRLLLNVFLSLKWTTTVNYLVHLIRLYFSNVNVFQLLAYSVQKSTNKCTHQQCTSSSSAYSCHRWSSCASVY